MLIVKTDVHSTIFCFPNLVQRIEVRILRGQQKNIWKNLTNRLYLYIIKQNKTKKRKKTIMKNLVALIAILVLASCGSGTSTEVNSTDSTVVAVDSTLMADTTFTVDSTILVETK